MLRRPATRPSTSSRLVTGPITERGMAEASRAGLRKLFPEHRASSFGLLRHCALAGRVRRDKMRPLA